MNAALAGMVFSASVLGSLHCVGMCGSFVASCVGAGPVKRRWLPQVGYQLGRLVTYAGLGGLAGAVGSAFDVALGQAGWVQGAAFVASVALLLSGVWALLPHRPALGRGRWTKTTEPLLRLGLRAPKARAPLIGLLTPLLPCGWLYAFVVLAAGTGNVWDGATLMAVFWSGSVPALLGLGWVVGRLDQDLRKHLPRAMAWLWLVGGLSGIALRLFGPALPAHAASATVPTEPSCHEHGP